MGSRARGRVRAPRRVRQLPGRCEETRAGPAGGPQCRWPPSVRRTRAKKAIAAFERAIAGNSTSPDLHNHLARTIVFKERFRNGALESESVAGNHSLLRRLVCDARLKKNPNNTGALYAQSIAYGIRSHFVSGRGQLRNPKAAFRRWHPRPDIGTNRVGFRGGTRLSAPPDGALL